MKNVFVEALELEFSLRNFSRGSCKYGESFSKVLLEIKSKIKNINPVAMMCQVLGKNLLR